MTLTVENLHGIPWLCRAGSGGKAEPLACFVSRDAAECFERASRRHPMTDAERALLLACVEFVQSILPHVGAAGVPMIFNGKHVRISEVGARFAELRGIVEREGAT